eukprot:scaffold42915_cov14-Tisochrysis_lutea.AAC.1
MQPPSPAKGMGMDMNRVSSVGHVVPSTPVLACCASMLCGSVAAAAGKFTFAFAGSADKMRGPLQTSTSASLSQIPGHGRRPWLERWLPEAQVPIRLNPNTK